MARGTPEYTNGSLTAAGSASIQTDQIVSVMETAIKAYKSASVDAWAEYQALDVALASRDTVYLSLGDRNIGGGVGDAKMYLRFTRASTSIEFRVYSDWSDTDKDGHQVQSSGGIAITAAPIEYWFVYNEYEFHGVFLQGGIWRYFGWGQAERVHMPTVNRGIAFTDAAVTGGGGPQVVGLDRSLLGNVTPGSTVWLINQTPTGQSLVANAAEHMRVGALTGAPDIQLLDPVNSFAAGALVGYDPQPFGVWLVQSSASPQVRMTFSWGAGVTALASERLASYHLPFSTAQAESVEDPETLTDWYTGQYPHLRETVATPLTDWRGRFTAVSFWGFNGQTSPNTDVMRDIITGAGYRPFPNLLLDGRVLAFFDPAA